MVFASFQVSGRNGFRSNAAEVKPDSLKTQTGSWRADPQAADNRDTVTARPAAVRGFTLAVAVVLIVITPSSRIAPIPSPRRSGSRAPKKVDHARQ